MCKTTTVTDAVAMVAVDTAQPIPHHKDYPTIDTWLDAIWYWTTGQYLKELADIIGTKIPSPRDQGCDAENETTDSYDIITEEPGKTTRNARYAHMKYDGKSSWFRCTFLTTQDGVVKKVDSSDRFNILKDGGWTQISDSHLAACSFCWH